MEKDKITAIKQQFDGIIHVLDEGEVEYWLARELMPLLGYGRWENFEKAIKRTVGLAAIASSALAMRQGLRRATIFVRSRKWSR